MMSEMSEVSESPKASKDVMALPERTRWGVGREERRELKAVGKEVFASRGKVVGSEGRRENGLKKETRANERSESGRWGREKPSRDATKRKSSEGRRRS